MAYKNSFWYNRDSSVESSYSYIQDLSLYKPIYGSSVSFSSRLNYLQTVDNSLKILPASQNNLIVKYNLKFLLTDIDTGNLLKTIETAGGTRYLKFSDPSGIYKDITGLVEDFSINKSSQILNEVNITVSSYFKSPMLNWRTSSFFNIDSSYDYSSFKEYKKYDFVFFETTKAKNKIDNFWFARDDIQPTNDNIFLSKKWSKNFIFEPKLPFELKNKFDFHQMDYKNSFIQNIKHKENSNSLKEYSIKFENISDKQCLSILLYFEKKCGFRRFVYDFPFLLKKAKVFICKDWVHTFKYKDCNDIVATFVEDPNPDMKDLFVEWGYEASSFAQDPNSGNQFSLFTGFKDGKLYVDSVLYGSSTQPLLYNNDSTFYTLGVPANGVFKTNPNSSKIHDSYTYFANGKYSEGIGILNIAPDKMYYGVKFKYDGLPLDLYKFGGVDYVKSISKVNSPIGFGFYFNGSLIYDFIDLSTLPPLITINNRSYFIVHDGLGYSLDGQLMSGIIDGLFFWNGKLADYNKNIDTYISRSDVQYDFYIKGYPLVSSVGPINTPTLNIFGQYLYLGNRICNASDGYLEFQGKLYYEGKRFNGFYNNKLYYNGLLFTGPKSYPSATSLFYINGIAQQGSDIGVVIDNYFYKYGYRVISNGYFNGSLYKNGVIQ